MSSPQHSPADMLSLIPRGMASGGETPFSIGGGGRLGEGEIWGENV